MPLPRTQLEQIRRLNSKVNGELKKLRLPPKWLFPLTAQRKYTAELYKLTFTIRENVMRIVMPAVPNLLLQATINFPDPVVTDSNTRNDDFIDDLNQLLEILTISLAPSITQAEESANRAGLEVALFNNAQFEKITKTVLGVDIFLEQPWLRNQLELFSSQNSKLIRLMTETEIDRVAGIIERAFQEGSTYDSIAENVQKSFGITRRHAKLIARDQTTKLNGSLTKLRQQELGIQTYRWQTGGDERVRPSHKALDGKICRWDDPTVYLDEKTGKWVSRRNIGGTLVHTSQDVNCRCVPLPQIEGIFI